MNPHDESRLAGHRHAFLRHLPRRVELIGRRLHRFLQDGWDINGLALMHEDARWLGDACRRHDLPEAGEHFGHLHQLLGETLAARVLPDPALGERLWHLVEDIGGAVPMATDTAPSEPAQSLRAVQSLGRAETPPPGYWRRWGDDAPPAVASAARQAAPAPAPPAPAPEPAAAPTPAPAPIERPAPAKPAAPAVHASPAASAPVAAGADGHAAPPAPEAGLRVYHLTDHGPLSLELDQRMEALGYEVELLESVEELGELLGALPAHLALVDASFTGELEAIGEIVRRARERVAHKVLLMALGERDDVDLRLRAQRVGVDALIAGPATSTDVLRRLAQLFSAGQEAPFRVLIVEDDRSQALFAEGILRNAGMQVRVVLDPLEVLEALHAFAPDLVLMDLHMPHANGIELTALIRDSEAFLHTPIVFLSGEADTDIQFDALEAGGDDFISKPVRPRHLIAAVQNRVQRARAMAARRQRASGKDPATGLYDRAELLERLAAEIAGGRGGGRGGALFLEVESANLLRDRLGLTALEQLLATVGQLLGERAGDVPVARFGDGSYLIVDATRDEAGLEALAGQLRGALVQHPFNVQGHPLRLRVSVGICAFAHPFPDPGVLLNAVERAAREARTSDKGLKRYEPAQPSEAAREASLVRQIRESIALNRLELHYQPVVAVAGSDETQYQVLLRLRGTDGRLMPAAEVVPMAERGDFIMDIDRWVLQASLRLIRERRAEGKALRLFVTQSPLTLADPGQAAWLKAELVANDVPGSALVVELRLEDAIVHEGTLRSFCDEVMDAGVQFCLSQFEAGAEANGLIERLPLGYVKLARKYTSPAMVPATRDELKVVIERAHRRGLEVIGHGVEDAQAAATLWMSGIDYIQGNLVQQADTGMDFDFQQAVL